MKEKDKGVTPPVAPLLDIRYLLPNGEDLLRKSVEENNGEALVIVHPFYDATVVRTNEDYGAYETCLINVFRSSKRPIFMFEEENEIGPTRIKLRLYSINTPVCFIPTATANPNPLITSTTNNSEEVENEWRYVAEKMIGPWSKKSLFRR